MEYLNLKSVNTVLDVGCSFGRMLDTLKLFGANVIGIDPDPYAIQMASQLAYKDLRVATAENTTLAQEEVDLVFCWASFDVVDQKKAIFEFNRVLSVGGEALITGKSWDYLEDDLLGINAEKNALAKSFPNHFTDLRKFLEMLPSFGFELVNLLQFEKRGDLGMLKFNESKTPEYMKEKSYEYLLHIKKITVPDAGVSLGEFSYTHSKVIQEIARASGFDSPTELVSGKC